MLSFQNIGYGTLALKFACIAGVFGVFLFVICLTTFKLKLIKIIRTLWNYDKGNSNIKKSKGSMSKTTTLYMHQAFLYISLLSMHNYDMKRPNFMF